MPQEPKLPRDVGATGFRLSLKTAKEPDMASTLIRPLAALLLLIGVSVGVAACGDTWDGMRDDTSDNLEKAKDAVD
jgi:hypothetical protein